jgi:hypothetical protein
VIGELLRPQGPGYLTVWVASQRHPSVLPRYSSSPRFQSLKASTGTRGCLPAHLGGLSKSVFSDYTLQLQALTLGISGSVLGHSSMEMMSMIWQPRCMRMLILPDILTNGSDQF